MPGPAVPLPKRIKGLGLVEIMVAMLAGLILLGGVMRIVVSSQASYGVQEALSRVQENGRFALQFIERDLQQAGFFGCLSRVAAPLNHLNTKDAELAELFDFSVPVTGIRRDGPAADEIVVRGAYSGSLPLTVRPPYGPLPSANIKVDAAAAQAARLEAGSIVAVGDCQSGDIFQITSGNPALNGTVVHNEGSGVSPGNAHRGQCPSGGCLSKVYRGDAEVLSVRSTRFSLGQGDGESNLYRQVNGGAHTPLVPGVEQMWVFYGVDSNEDYEVDRYLRADAVTDWQAVRAVRVALLVAAPTGAAYVREADQRTYTVPHLDQPVGPFADGRVRQVFTKTVTLRNRVR